MWNNQQNEIGQGDTPLSRTLQYRKVTKPLLERKRRARINHCLDELKELMVNALQAEGENVSKLEKADILELTVRYLHSITATNKEHVGNGSPEEAQKFQAGFAHCIRETYQYLHQSPEVDTTVSQRLVSHLGNYIQHISTISTQPNQQQITMRSHNEPQDQHQPTVPLSVDVPPMLQRPYSPQVTFQRPFSPPVSPVSPLPSTSDQFDHGYNVHVVGCSTHAQDLSRPSPAGLLIPVKQYPVRPQPQRMWRPW